MNPITSRVWAARNAENDDPAIDQIYFHLVRADRAADLGEPEPPPKGVRVWMAEDWFDTPAERMFASFIGDCQPRAVDGGVLRTGERLAITAAAAERGHLPCRAWTAVDAEKSAPTLWIEGAGGGAIPVTETEEPDARRALRDLPGKHGYNRARGTENIDRPSQEARTAALALRIDEIARGSGIDLERNDPAKVDPSELPSLTEHADGGVTMGLTNGWTSKPSTPDLFEEATAVAIGRAYQTAEPGPGRLEQATIAGIIAGHQLVQSAGLKTMAVTHGNTVAEWRKQLKRADPGAADRQARATVELAERIETDLALPRTERQQRQWDDRRKARAAPADTAPVRRAGAKPGGGRPETTARPDHRAR